MLKTDESVHYFHMPGLFMEEPGLRAVGGELAPLSFEEFERLDRDWAKEAYFKMTAPAVWKIHAEDSAEELSRAHEAQEARALLVYHALLAATQGDYPDPRLSSSYSWRRGAVFRKFGPLDRTFLLNGFKGTALPAQTLERIRALAQVWLEAGFTPGQAVFAPLRALSITALGKVPPDLAPLPAIVSLEGYLIASKVKGIANTLVERAARLLGDEAPADLRQTIRTAYAWRSSVVHGAPFPVEACRAVDVSLRRLIASVVVAMAERLARLGLDGNSLDGVRAKLEQPA